ncbi:MAG TPA: hypothetical protein VM735_01320 [Candidatus Kapabacteria bacterium]|nr:hypothetical protein [Candidatus Kapabacteria bacterium]
MAATTNTPIATKSVELPIEALPKVYWAIVAASTSTEAEWQELCNARLSAECTGCKIKLTGLEMRELATVHTEGSPQSPKLERLRKNYCARNTCESRFYRVNVQPDNERHWLSIKEQLQIATPEVRETEPGKDRKPFFANAGVPRLRPLQLTGLILIGVVLFFIVRHWVYGSRIPLVQKKNEYRVIQSND